MPRRFLRLLPPALGVLVLAGIIFGLHGALKRIGPRDVLHALAATPGGQVLDAFLLLAVSFCIMTIYDLPGVLFARKLLHLPQLLPHRIALASFCAYALSHVLGAPALTGAAIRVRLYAEWRVPPVGIGRIIALSGTMFMLGAATLASLILLLHPHAVPLFRHDLKIAVLRAAGGVLLALVLVYVLVAGRAKRSFVVFKRQLPLPGSGIALSQLMISCADISVAGSILFTVLPATHGLSLPHVLAIYLAAFAGGSLSGLPAGIGVFDTMLLLALSPYMNPAAAIGAILLFRVIYSLIPACVAALCFAAHEIFLTAKGQTS